MELYCLFRLDPVSSPSTGCVVDTQLNGFSPKAKLKNSARVAEFYVYHFEFVCVFGVLLHMDKSHAKQQCYSHFVLLGYITCSRNVDIHTSLRADLCLCDLRRFL